MSLRSKLQEANLIQDEIESIPPRPTIALLELPIVENTPEKSTICATKTTDSRSSMKQTITINNYILKSQPKQDQDTKRTIAPRKEALFHRVQLDVHTKINYSRYRE